MHKRWQYWITQLVYICINKQKNMGDMAIYAKELLKMHKKLTSGHEFVNGCRTYMTYTVQRYALFIKIEHLRKENVRVIRFR